MQKKEHQALQRHTRRKRKAGNTKGGCASVTYLEKFTSWEFVFVDDKDMIGRLADTRGQSSAFLKEAPLCLAVLGNEKANDTWIEDASIAAVIVQLTALSLGLGSCWIQIRNRMHSPEVSAEDYVRPLLNIPREYRVVCLIAIGYPAEEKAPHDSTELRWDKIHLNKW